MPQVSFYRGEVPVHLPEELAQKRKGPDHQWLATLPVKLPVGGGFPSSALTLKVLLQVPAPARFKAAPLLSSQACENGVVGGDGQHPPLNLGDPESGYLTESNLLSISLQIGQDWRVIGINLGLSYQELDRIQYKNR